MNKLFKKIAAVVVAASTAVVGLTGCVAGEGSAASAENGEALSVIKLDYAYWNPLSLVIKDQGWAEEEFAKQGATVEWVLSAGSSKALENLNAEAIDVASSAGSAAFAARANGATLKTIGVFSQPNWATIVVPKGSDITSVAALKGKKIAAASGTDPYFFLLRSLSDAGLSTADVEIVNLIHADGQKALESGDVDAWAGLDPLTATSERTAGSVILSSKPEYNSWGVLSVNEKFLAAHAAELEIVLSLYEKARTWIAENQDAAVAILARDASLDEGDARKVLLERTKVDVSIIPGAEQKSVLEAITPVLVAEGKIKSQEAADSALASIYDTVIAEKVAK